MITCHNDGHYDYDDFLVHQASNGRREQVRGRRSTPDATYFLMCIGNAWGSLKYCKECNLPEGGYMYNNQSRQP
jgi:hypothetical protein